MRRPTNITPLSRNIYHAALIYGVFVTMLCRASANYTTPFELEVEDAVETAANQSVLHLSLRRNDSFYLHRVSAAPMNRLAVDFEISYPVGKCCPAIYFYAQTPNPPYNSTHVNHRCFTGGRGFLNVVTFSSYFIYFRRGAVGVTCEERGTRVFCRGKRNFAFAMPRTFWFMASYQCEKLQPLDLDIRMQFEFDPPAQCDEEILIGRCGEMFNYTYTVFPNRFGQSSQSEASKLLRTIELLLTTSGCYQHGMLLACKSLFQGCGLQSGIEVPCQQMCRDFAQGCHAPLVKWKQRVRCGNMPPSLDPAVCVYKPVICGKPGAPSNGNVTTTGGHKLSSTALYTCDQGYKLVGERSRQCLHSGKWNGTIPVCKKRRRLRFRHKLLLALIFLVILLIGIGVGMCIRFKENVALVFVYNDYINSKLNPMLPDGRKQRNLFLTYSSMDADYVNNYFLPQMAHHLPSWNVITFEKDFIPGQPLLECINEGIWKNEAVLVLLTDNYINSTWCEYEFSEAQTRSVQDKDFKLIILLHEFGGNEEKELNIEKLPEELRNYVRTRIYLKIKEKLFWNKLRQGLSQ